MSILFSHDPQPPACLHTDGKSLLGVLGGMGPLATADFLTKLVIATPAAMDQDHIPLVIISDPTIPDRTEAVLSGQEQSVLEALTAAMNRLVLAGAKAIVMPCNTAHHWHDRLQPVASVPFIHIADAAIAATRSVAAPGTQVAVFATTATLRSGFYADRLKAAGYVPVPLDEATEQAVMASVRCIKAGQAAEGRKHLDDALARLDGHDVQAILLACTELPIAAADRLGTDPRLVDVTQALVDACIRWSGTTGRRPTD